MNKPLKAGDVYVVCSDGLSGPVHDREIGAVASALSPDEAARFLIHLANLQGGPDNITAVVAKIRGESTPPPTAAATPIPHRWSGSELRQRLWNATKDWPWAFIALVLGILVAGLALLLSATEMGGDFLAFVVAGLLLIGGIAGLIVQSFREPKVPPPVEEPRKLQIYRQIPCAIDETLVDRLDAALAGLQQHVTTSNWPIDEANYRRHLDLGAELRTKKAWRDAFAERCRAMMVLMEAMQQHRGKEESFRPNWDKRNGSTG